MTVIWSPLALERVAEIATWIAADRPSAAERVVKELFEAAKRLSRFPESGRQVPEFGRPELREALHGGYWIVYRIADDHVAILTVRHSLQFGKATISTSATVLATNERPPGKSVAISPPR